MERAMKKISSKQLLKESMRQSTVSLLRKMKKLKLITNHQRSNLCSSGILMREQ